MPGLPSLPSNLSSSSTLPQTQNMPQISIDEPYHFSFEGQTRRFCTLEDTYWEGTLSVTRVGSKLILKGFGHSTFFNEVIPFSLWGESQLEPEKPVEENEEEDEEEEDEKEEELPPHIYKFILVKQHTMHELYNNSLNYICLLDLKKKLVYLQSRVSGGVLQLKEASQQSD